LIAFWERFSFFRESFFSYICEIDLSACYPCKLKALPCCDLRGQVFIHFYNEPSIHPDIRIAPIVKGGNRECKIKDD